MAGTDLAGRAVAITGGGRGIGRALAEACLRAGMRVAIADLDRGLSERTAAEIGGGTVGFGLDVRDRAAFAAFLEGVEERLGALEVLVNNAGVFHLGRFDREDPEETERQVAVNLTAVLHGSRLALDRFLPRGSGHLVNIASSAGLVGTAGAVTYSATKHGVVGLTRALRGELRNTGVRTTVVMPGIVRTEMIEGFAVPPVMRTIEPADLADAVIDAMRTGREEVIVPRETTPLAKLFGVLPPRPSDGLKRVLRLDRVMLDADRGKHDAYEARFEAEHRRASSGAEN